jgi:hypothetical protein
MTDQELVAEAESLVSELQQTQDPEAKLIVLSRAWALMQRVIGELEHRAGAGEVDPSDTERIHALAAGFEEGTRNFAEVLRAALDDEAPR